jgi:hypothetical protein
MLEYVYTEKQFKRSVRTLILLWALNFSLRVTLFILYGQAFTHSLSNILLINVSGIIVGLTIRTFVMRRKSAKISAHETETGELRIL